MRRIVHSKPAVDNTPAEVSVPDPVISDISVDGLIGDGLLALYREIKNIMIMSAKGKLDAAYARDLRDHLKLLFEIKDREADFLSKLTDEQLDQLAEKVKASVGSNQ
jgi:hypothetical protein